MSNLVTVSKCVWILKCYSFTSRQESESQKVDPKLNPSLSGSNKKYVSQN